MLRPLVRSEELGAHTRRSATALSHEGQWILERVAALACWCAGVGISALTVYDADGRLVNSIDDLVRAQMRHRKDVHPSVAVLRILVLL